jgi:hypothetical protein
MRKQQDPHLSALSRELSTLQSEFRLLEQEWVETHRKLLNTLRSINRGGGKKAPDVPAEAQPAVPPAMDPWTAAILARRQKNGLQEKLANLTGQG